ncbi:MAG: ABC transporter permease [Chloroflexota bacterium]|nr:ABC transporter permease [Chloroflexota bacterium]
MHLDPKREVTHSSVGRLGIALFLLIVLMAVFAPLLANHDPIEQTIHSLESPSLNHLLGTNHVGQDIWSQLVHGARTSLLVGLLVALLSTILSAIVGTSAALIGGLYDRIVMRIVDAFIVMPLLIVMILVSAYLGAGLGATILLLSLLSWQGGARIVRSQSLSLKERVHISAARGFGANKLYIMRRHLIPDLGTILIVDFIYSVRRAIFLQAGLAFIGIGDPNIVSWGTMMREALDWIFLDVWRWWLLPAGIALSLTIVSITFIGHALEPALDPRLKDEANV